MNKSRSEVLTRLTRNEYNIGFSRELKNTSTINTSTKLSEPEILACYLNQSYNMILILAIEISKFIMNLSLEWVGLISCTLSLFGPAFLNGFGSLSYEYPSVQHICSTYGPYLFSPKNPSVPHQKPLSSTPSVPNLNFQRRIDENLNLKSYFYYQNNK